MRPVGICSIGVSIPPLALAIEELAVLRSVDQDKYKTGLGLEVMAICPNGQHGVLDLAITAARRALSNWGGKIEDIGLLAVGTETPLDLSRPLSAWVAEALNIKGHVRSYEVKHACYGGTLALKQAAEWCATQDQHKVALIIAADVALYKADDPGEPTQGAGAVAMIIGRPQIAQLTMASIPYSEPVFDFWKPLDEHFPHVDGHYSLECYKRAAIACFDNFMQRGKYDNQFFQQYAALCFHVPFPKMVKKAFYALGEHLQLATNKIDAIYQDKVDHFMEWNRQCGNAYTASLWIAVVNALAKVNSGEEILAFSYGSGCGAELLHFTKANPAQPYAWREQLQQDLAKRRYLRAEEYAAYRLTY